MATLPKVLINQADSKSAGGVALRVRTQVPLRPDERFAFYESGRRAYRCSTCRRSSKRITRASANTKIGGALSFAADPLNFTASQRLVFGRLSGGIEGGPCPVR